MQNADEFIDKIAELELVPDSVIRRLRKKNSSSSGGLSAQSIAKYLVKNGFLSSAQAGDLPQRGR